MSITRRRGIALALATLLMACVLPMFAHAMTPISQGYNTAEPVSIGSLVSVKNNLSDTVEPATTKTSGSLIGVAINDGTSLLEIGTTGAKQVQVATSGIVPALVSNYNGEIKQGDPITSSPIKGVGMKATSNAKVIGLAQGTMSGTNKQMVKVTGGSEQEVTFGQVDVLVSVSYHYQEPDKTIIPAALQNVANSIAGRKVDSTPIIVSAIIFIVMIVIVSSIIYSMIRSSIISVGRNPMAQSAVYRDIIQLSILVLAIIGVSVVAIYLVLTRM